MATKLIHTKDSTTEIFSIEVPCLIEPSNSRVWLFTDVVNSLLGRKVGSSSLRVDVSRTLRGINQKQEIVRIPQEDAKRYVTIMVEAGFRPHAIDGIKLVSYRGLLLTMLNEEYYKITRDSIKPPPQRHRMIAELERLLGADETKEIYDILEAAHPEGPIQHIPGSDSVVNTDQVVRDLICDEDFIETISDRVLSMIRNRLEKATDHFHDDLINDKIDAQLTDPEHLEAIAKATVRAIKLDEIMADALMTAAGRLIITERGDNNDNNNNDGSSDLESIMDLLDSDIENCYTMLTKAGNWRLGRMLLHLDGVGRDDYYTVTDKGKELRRDDAIGAILEHKLGPAAVEEFFAKLKEANTNTDK